MKSNDKQSDEKKPLLAGDDDGGERPLLIAQETVADAMDEDTDAAEAASQERSYELPGPAWMGYVFAVLPIFACLFGAGREAWSKAIITIPMALVLIFFAPQRKMPKLAFAGLVGAVTAPLLMFLPANDWFGVKAAWRKTLETDWGIELSQTLTPQAAVTFEAWLLFALCCAWLSWCLARGFSDQQRRAMIQTLTFGGILLCALSIIEGSKWVSIPWWPRNQIAWGHGFGPFANRNHISSIAAMTAVLCSAAAYDAHRRKSRLWLLFLIGFLVPTICIFMNSSRAGLVLLFLGMTTWFGTIAMRRGFFQKMAVSASLIFIISTLLVMSGGNVSKRLTEEGLINFASGQGRADIFTECLKMIIDAPWMGVGLGNFDPVFSQVSGIEEPVARFIHPESDLLWLLAEGGLLTVLSGMLLLLWVLLSTGPWFGKKKRKSGMQDRRLRNASAIAFGIGAVHGLGDVPNHGLAYALFMGLLAGIAIRPRRLPEASGLAQRVLFRFIGIAALTLGGAWAAISLGHPALPGASAAEALRERALGLVEKGSPAGALPLLNDAIEMKPMDFRLYFDRARVRLMLGQAHNDALNDFARSRVLEPHYARYAYTEGVIWLDYAPPLAIIPWRETLQRWPGHNYWAMLAHAKQHPELFEPLWSLATTASLKMEYLIQVRTREEFEPCLRSLLIQQPDLEGLEPAQRERLFNIWYQLGDQSTLISALETNQKWRNDGWRLLAAHYARNSDFQRACQTVIPYLPSIIRTAPGTSSDIPALERALLYNPTDARHGIDLFQAQKNQGDIDGALRTLEKVATIPNAPSYIRQEIAALYVMKQDFRRAWEYLRDAMEKR
jgi:O-antigen ligase/tetratricopeptide (TPR) repeat protein